MTLAESYECLLLTGAAGALGRVLRPKLLELCGTLRVSDIAPLGQQAAREECRQAALEDAAAVDALLTGVDGVVHMGGISTEQPWAPILQANIIGLYHLYDAAVKHGVRRIVFASSNHVIGYYRQDQVIDDTVPLRPDGLYGLSKAFGENIARLYFDRFGIETVCLRIGSAFPEPKDRRMLSTWMSHDDLWRLVKAALTAPVAGFSIIYGTSDNASSFWDNRHALHLGYRPRDSSEPFRARIEAADPRPDPSDPATLHQGGSFTRPWPEPGPRPEPGPGQG